MCEPPTRVAPGHHGLVEGAQGRCLLEQDEGVQRPERRQHELRDATEAGVARMLG